MYKFENAYNDSDLVKAISERRGRGGGKDKRADRLKVGKTQIPGLCLCA